MFARVEALKKWRVSYGLQIQNYLRLQCVHYDDAEKKMFLLQNFQYEIEYRSSSRMRYVDALRGYLVCWLQQAQQVVDWVWAVVKLLEYWKYADFNVSGVYSVNIPSGNL